ncbi:MAG: TAT-variant-translocated molybdopterin oxidoreductase [Thermoanaerobaculia bacterium]
MADKTYWKSPEDRDANAGNASEFAEALDLSLESVDRRSFLKVAGFSVGAAAIAGCTKSVVETAIPYLGAQENVVPGRPYWIASTCGGCEAACGILVKCRDGRPIKLEGNPSHPLSHGGLCAVGQASILELYDSQRLRHPLAHGKKATWASVDAAITAGLQAARERGGRVRVLTTSYSGPATRAVIDDFVKGFADGRVVVWDPVSTSSILDAHAATHGLRALPRYRFDRAVVVVSVDADFLGTWISPVEYTAGYTARRRVAPGVTSMSWHVQCEPRMTLTGGKADKRHVIHPSEARAVLAHVANRIAAAGGVAKPVSDPGVCSITSEALDAIAAKLRSARGTSLVVCGSQDVATQRLANWINETLGNYGRTLELAPSSMQRRGDDAAVAKLVEEIRGGQIDALVIAGVNPVYDLPGGAELAAALDKLPLVVSFAEREDETAKHAHFVCPDHHFLEAWRDYEPVDGIFAVGQPAIAPLGATRSMLESLSRWSGTRRAMDTIVRETTWHSSVASRTGVEPVALWDKTLSEGSHSMTTVSAAPVWNAAANVDVAPVAPKGAEGMALVLYPTVGMLDGRHAHNPWLHELPDPVTKVTWDNYACLSEGLAKRLGIVEGQVVNIAAGGLSLSLPALIQPGQHDDVVAVPMGYGRAGTERFADVGPKWFFKRKFQKDGAPVGKRASEFATIDAAGFSLVRYGVALQKTEETLPLAATQRHHSLTVPEKLNPTPGKPRPFVQEATFTEWKADPHSGEPEGHHFDADLWKSHAYTGPKWGMAIDLSACTGCSGCVIGCQAENNIPVVGKDEVLRQREMHWMRIDRYYADTADGVDMVHQPMLCAHCENASCESVCPVIATVHSSEGLNQQVYNRCVGTRYCANNCPYKVRRFNWFDYPHEDRLQNMVLNPDVVVRSRGVMEKCSMCVQRIEAAKIEAKRLGVPVADGDVKTACQQSCPAQAILFGDLNDPESQVSKARRDPRYYVVLGELNLRPAVGYMRIVRNRDESEPEEMPHV